jgi:hypothetical protein
MLNLKPSEYAQLLAVRADAVKKKLCDDSSWREVRESIKDLKNIVEDIDAFVGTK